MVSFTHEQNIICRKKKLDDITHEQTIICKQLFCRSRSGLLANEKEEKFATKDNSIYLTIIE